jgi:hypothetical protein
MAPNLPDMTALRSSSPARPGLAEQAFLESIPHWVDAVEKFHSVT